MARLTTEDFNSSKYDTLKQCIKLLEKLITTVELVSYGLAPNVNGFCYELLIDRKYLDPTRFHLLSELDQTLNALSLEEEEELKHLYL